MRAFITGITGFIGSHVAELLLSEGDLVMGATRSWWHADVPKALVEAVELVRWDIQESASTEVSARVAEFRPEVIYHFAGISIPSLCGAASPSAHAISVNVNGTSNLLNFAANLSNPRVIFASTCHVYDRVEKSAPFTTEDMAERPISAYGITKLQSEREILRRVRESDLDACIARGFHHIGPRQPSGLMLTDWLEQLEDPTRTELHVRCANSYLDMVDVHDAAEAYRLLGTKGSIGEIYNLGSGRISKSGDVLDAILSLVPRDLTVIESSKNEQWNAIAEISKLKSLGWDPKTEYAATIREMMADRKIRRP